MTYSKKWIDLLNEVSEFQKGKQFTWFRGQNNSKFKLNSGLYRKKLSNPKNYVATEKYYYTMFQRMGYLHHNESDWNLLFMMQHHGVKQDYLIGRNHLQLLYISRMKIGKKKITQWFG